MSAFTTNLTNLYLSINDVVGFDFFEPFITSWIEVFFGSDGAIFRFIMLFIIFNLINRPSKYRFKLFGLPMVFQFAIRQVMYFFIATNGVAFMLAILSPFFIGMFYLFVLSDFAPSPGRPGFFRNFLNR